MPGGFPYTRGLCNPFEYGSQYANYTLLGTDLAVPASPNTKGAWTNLGTLSADCVALYLKCVLSTSTSSARAASFDIGIGPGGSQIVLVPNIVGSASGSYTQSTADILLPLGLPAGTQLWARVSLDSVATGGCQIEASAVGYDGNFSSDAPQGVDALGYVSAGLGTVVALGNGSKGSYTQIIAATSRDYCGIIVGGDIDGGTSSTVALLDIGLGSPQKIIIADDVIRGVGSGGCFGQFYDVHIPAGSQLSARGMANTGSVINIGVTVYGVY
jgi:hypothetical protein